VRNDSGSYENRKSVSHFFAHVERVDKNGRVTHVRPLDSHIGQPIEAFRERRSGEHAKLHVVGQDQVNIPALAQAIDSRAHHNFFHGDAGFAEARDLAKAHRGSTPQRIVDVPAGLHVERRSGNGVQSAGWHVVHTESGMTLGFRTDTKAEAEDAAGHLGRTGVNFDQPAEGVRADLKTHQAAVSEVVHKAQVKHGLEPLRATPPTTAPEQVPNGPFQQQQRRHVAARAQIQPSTADITAAAAQWQRDNPGKTLAGHEREVDRISHDIAERKFVRTGVRSQNTPEEAAAERERARRSVVRDAAFRDAEAKRLAAEKTAPRGISEYNARAIANGGNPDAVRRLQEQSDANAKALGLNYTRGSTVHVTSLSGDHMGTATVHGVGEHGMVQLNREGQAPTSLHHSHVHASKAEADAAAGQKRAELEQLRQKQGRELAPGVFEHTPEGQARIAAQNASKRAQVEHSGDGTLLHIDRNDTEARAAAKAAGFKWSSNLGSWFLPRNWSEPTRRQKIAQLQGALGHDNVHLEDAGRGVTTTAAEREADARARAADRATHMDAKAQRLATEADVRFGRAKAIGDMIPFGQPILVGHHSEARHRRDLAKIDTNMRKGIEAHSEAQAAAAAAERARAATAGDSPLARQRRIDRKEAEVRKIDRALKNHELAQKISNTGRDPRRFGVYPSDPSHVEQMQANRAQLVDEIAHDKAQIAAAGHQTIDRANVSAGDVIHYRGRAHVVSKVNQTTVSVPTGYSWDDKVPVNQITRHVKMADLSEASLRSAFTLAKANPKLRATLLRELNRRGVSAADL
jgi:hypothetical protein